MQIVPSAQTVLRRRPDRKECRQQPDYNRSQTGLFGADGYHKRLFAYERLAQDAPKDHLNGAKRSNGAQRLHDLNGEEIWLLVMSCMKRMKACGF